MDKIKKAAMFSKSWILHILFPRVCFHCKADMPRTESALLCENCRKDLKQPEGVLCKRCGLPLKDGGAYCYDCGRKAKANFKCSFIRSSLRFTPPSRALVHAFKYEKYMHISKFFASLMYKTLKNNPEFFEADLLIPVPIHRSKLRSRGFNQAELLARDLSLLSDIPFKNVLQRSAKTKSQTSLGRKERKENIKDAFICTDKGAVKKKAVIVIDDVCTTTATLEECAKVLRKAGAREVLALTALRE
jgi:ComF family protein